MIGLDTNVLVRYLVQDDRKQSAVASRLIQQLVDAEETACISGIVLCELVWVLESGYGLGKEVVSGVLETLLQTRQFEIEDRDSAWRALSSYTQGKADFSDYLIGERNRLGGCRHTVTFDRALRSEPDFHVL